MVTRLTMFGLSVERASVLEMEAKRQCGLDEKAGTRGAD